MTKDSALLIFAKSPVAGTVKTRLIPEIGVEKATKLYKELLTGTLDTAISSGVTNIQLWISGDVSHPYFKDMENKECFNFCSQYGDDLGERMFNAFADALSKVPYAVLIGSDCAELLSTDIQSAMKLLENGKDVVLGPAVDGGYYLIGLRKNRAELFSGISWGEESVFTETLSRVEQLNLDIALLSKRNDIDRLSDLENYYRKTECEF